MFDFLKKKKIQQETSLGSDKSLDDLPPAPVPNQNFAAESSQIQSQEPHMPPIPENDTPAPPPPKSFNSELETKEQTSPFGDINKTKEEITNETKDDEELSPLPEAPNIPDDEELSPSESMDNEVNEPAPISAAALDPTKPVSPKDIDPRDRFDDLLNLENTPELPSPESESENNSSDEPQEIKNSEEDMLESTNQNESEKFIDKLSTDNSELNRVGNSQVSSNISPEDIKLPSAENLVEQLGPILAKDIPPPAQNLRTEFPQRLPSFDDVLPEQTVSESLSHKGSGNFALPELRISPMSEKELSIYVSVNDYALVTQMMKRLTKFFSQSGKLLGQTDNPEKIHVLNELYKELNMAQQRLMEVDKKLFEGESYGA